MNKNRYSKYLILRVIRHLFKWIISNKFRKNWSLIFPNVQWHYKVSSFLAKYIYWIFYPIAKKIEENNIVFSYNNISTAVGHVYLEFDYLLRKKKIINKNIYCIWPKTPITCLFHVYENHLGINVLLSGFLSLLIYPLILRYKFLGIDSGLSDVNHGLDIRVNKPLNYRDTYLKHCPYFALVANQPDMHGLRSLSKNSFPEEIKNIIKNKKYIVIQIKDKAVNATYHPIDPKTYIPVIIYMKNKGYEVVLGGREVMPLEFKELGVIDYANSTLATAQNDYFIVRDSHMVLSSGSGFSAIADTLGKPLLIINIWNFLWVGGKKTICIPSRLKINDKFMKYIDQYKYALDRGQLTSDRASDSRYECVDSTGESIFDAWKELEHRNLINDWSDSPLQLKFRKMFAGEPIGIGLSRVSNEFLQNCDGF